MQTIFDYNPTNDELNAIGFFSFPTMISLCHVGEVTKEIYLSNIAPDKAIFDIAILHEHRKQDAATYWSQIPELHAEYVRGFDNDAIAQ